MLKRGDRTNWTGIVSTLFVLSLALVAGTLGFLTNKFLSEAENELAEKQFESIADRALDSAYEITLRKRLAGVTLASFASTRFPDSVSWPFVLVNGYITIASNLIDMSSGRGIGFAPIVTGEQLEIFESFAHDHFDAAFPAGSKAGYSSFGFGVFGVDPVLNTTDNRYREIDGKTRRYNSTNEFLAPILQHNKGPRFSSYLQNIHHDPVRGKVLDNILDCNQRKQENEGGNEAYDCGEISDMLFGRGEPGAHIIQPIYPANEPHVITGFIASSILWREALENVFVDEVSGVDCVLQSETEAYTYTVTSGITSIKGKGDLHDGKYTNYGRTTYLTGPPGVFFSNSSVSYRLTLYPNGDLFGVYSTNNPLVGAIVVICTIVFTSLLFFLYDYLVRQEFHQKQCILETKRQFVRFVSHEVRTPLNAACMGLQLMQEDIIGSNFPSDIDFPSKDLSEPSSKNSMNATKLVFEKLLGLSREVLSHTESAVDILNEVLNYDKIEMGIMNLDLTVIPIWDLIERTSKEFRVPTAVKKISLSLDLSKLVDNVDEGLTSSFMAMQLPPDVREYCVIGDAIRITQVLRNLLSNALKFTGEGGALTVTASISESNDNANPISKKGKAALDTFTLAGGEEISCDQSGHLQLTVADTGAGMSEDQLAQLFQSGVQFNKNLLQAGSGSGFGLYISKGIIEEHAGTLTAASKGLGQGSTFTVRLPLYKVSDKELLHLKHLETGKNASSTPFRVSAKNAVGKLRILVVDDSLTNRKLLMCLLQKRGHYCEEAKNGKEAIEKVRDGIQRENPFDTILLDYEMPEMDGPTAAKEISRMGSDSLLIGITGNILSEDVAYFKQCAVSYVLPKPIQINALDEILCSWKKKKLDTI